MSRRRALPFRLPPSALALQPVLTFLPALARLPALALLPVLTLLPVVAARAPDAPAPGPAVRFMGLEAEASRIAFVCDGSRWTDTKDDELFAELLRAVKPLAPEQHFSVIFFADGKGWGPGDGRPMPATDQNKRALRDWLHDLETGRQSTPAPGLKLALEGKPDTVFFVSDGHFDDYTGVASLVTTLNPERAVRVHAIGYFRNEEEDDSRSFVEFLRALARDHGGQFKVAYADEMRRRPE